MSQTLGENLLEPHVIEENANHHLDGEERAGCFALTVFLMSWDSKCSVYFPLGAVSWSAVCDCGISCSYSLAFWLNWISIIAIHF